MKKINFHLALMALTITVTPLAAQSGPQIEITDLGTLGSNFGQAVAVNESGQAVGRSRTATGPEDHAFSWTEAGGITDLGTLGGNRSVALAVNDVGQVVGESRTGTGDEHAYVWTATNGMLDLGTLGTGIQSGASAINDLGTAVGFSLTTAGPPCFPVDSR